MVSYLRSLFKKIDAYAAYACFFAIFIAACLLPYYSKGSIILGGEGDFVINFKALLDNFNFAWINMATGIPATSLNFNYFNIFFYALIQDLSVPISLINFMLIFSLYFLPFIGVFLIACELKIEPLLSFLISAFYVINPFSVYFLISLNQWNSLILFVMPFSFYLILKYYADNIRLFFYFGLFTFIFAFTNANPPLMVTYQLSLFTSLIFIHFYKHNPSLNLILLIKKCLIILVSFILFNAWWIFNWIQVFSSDVAKMYTADFAIRYARELVNAYPCLFLRVFSLTSLISASNITNYLSVFYNTAFSYFVALIPLIIVSYYLYRHFPAKLYLRFLISIILLVIFLSKGPSGLFGFLYDFAMLHIPFFSVFKTPPEKWGVLLVFLISLLLIFISQSLKNEKKYKIFFYSFLFYLIFCSIPFVTIRFIPDYKMFDGNQSSRRFVDKMEYREIREQINIDPKTYRVLVLPGSTNYQVSLLMYKDKHYTGMDPVANNINKQFIAAYSTNYIMNFDVLFDNFSLPHISRLFSLFNIGKVVLIKDMEPWFGYKENESTSTLEALFGKTMKRNENGAIDVYTPQDFLPRFYTPSNTVLVRTQNVALAPLAETDLLLNSPALFFINQDNNPNKNILESLRDAQFDSMVLVDDTVSKERKDKFLSSLSKNPTYLFPGVRVAGLNGDACEDRCDSSIFQVMDFFEYSLKVILNPKDNKRIPDIREISSQGLFEIDGKIYIFDDFKPVETNQNAKKIVAVAGINLSKGMHVLKNLKNSLFDVQWVILEPKNNVLKSKDNPQVTFKKINPAKYLLDVEGAKAPFWLVFSETFHKKWELYTTISTKSLDTPDQIIADYKDLHVKEARHADSFCPTDIKYLFIQPLETGHYQVNGYANAWYIDPKQSGLGENFNLTVFFWPQSLFYLGMGISALAFVGGLIALGIRRFRIKHDE